jgi:hypothetical protein
MASWTRFGSGTDEVVAAWNNLLILIQRGEVTATTMAHFESAAKSILARHKEMAVLMVIEPNSPPPSAEVRSTLSQILAVHRARNLRTVVVPEGGGFRSATVRGVGTALSLLAPKAFAFTFGKSVEEAAAALAPLVNSSGGAAGIVRTIADLRQA